jgi:hypothetical protein
MGGPPTPLQGGLAILKRDCIFITAIKRYLSIDLYKTPPPDPPKCVYECR